MPPLLELIARSSNDHGDLEVQYLAATGTALVRDSKALIIAVTPWG